MAEQRSAGEGARPGAPPQPEARAGGPMGARQAAGLAAGLVAIIGIGLAMQGPWPTLLGAPAAGALIRWGVRARQRLLLWSGGLLLALATVWTLLLSTFPGWVGQGMPGPWLRGALFLVTAGALGASLTWLGQTGPGQAVLTRLTLAASVVPAWYLTLEVTLAFDGRHNGRIAGHEGLMVAAVWGLYGLALALLARRLSTRALRIAARAWLMAALGYLVLGALLGNARWALWPYRLFAYGAVLGSTWAVEGLFRRYAEDREEQGLLGLTAALLGFGICGFEVTRWLEPAFKLPEGQRLTAELLAWQQSTRAFWNGAVWGIYALAVMAAGVLLRSAQTRLLAAGLFGAAMLVTAVKGVPNPAADPGLRMLAFAALVPGGCVAAALSARVREGRHPYEPLFARALLLGAAALTAYWGIAEWMAARG